MTLQETISSEKSQNKQLDCLGSNMPLECEQKNNTLNNDELHRWFVCQQALTANTLTDAMGSLMS